MQYEKHGCKTILRLPTDVDTPQAAHPLASYHHEILDMFVGACVHNFATMRQLALHGLMELLLSGLLTDLEVWEGVLCADDLIGKCSSEIMNTTEANGVW